MMQQMPPTMKIKTETLDVDHQNPSYDVQATHDFETVTRAWLSTLPADKTLTPSEVQNWLQSNHASLPDHIKSMPPSDVYHLFTSFLNDGAPSSEVDYYDASLTIKSKISIAKDILARLRECDRRLTIFRGSCFGSWLDIQTTYGDPLLIHLILQTQVFPEDSLTDEMWFRVGGKDLRFGREEFCLITGLRFGPMPSLPEISGNPFRDRVFPHIPSHQKVKGSDLRDVFTSREFAQISDLDAVRICLLLLLEVGFVGRQQNLVVTDFLLRLVEDLDSWNRYPWGSYVWALTYQQLKTALPRRRHHVGVKSYKVAKYTLTGFVFAFKIWIFETFPIARKFALRQSDVIPRAIAWQRTHAIKWNRCLTFLNFDNADRLPLTVLSPTDAERGTGWWRDSQRFFDGAAEEFQRPAKRVRFYSPPLLPPPPPLSPSPPSPSPTTSSAEVEASSPEAATTIPTPLEQRVTVLEETVRDMQASQRTLCDNVTQLHETMQRALEISCRDKVRSEDAEPSHLDDVAEGEPSTIVENVSKSEMKSQNLKARILLCSGGAWEVVNGVWEYMPSGIMKRLVALPLDISYSGLINVVARKLNLVDVRSGFRLSYKIPPQGDVVELLDDDDVLGFTDIAVSMSEGMVTLFIVKCVGSDGNRLGAGSDQTCTPAMVNQNMDQQYQAEQISIQPTEEHKDGHVPEYEPTCRVVTSQGPTEVFESVGVPPPIPTPIPIVTPRASYRPPSHVTVRQMFNTKKNLKLALRLKCAEEGFKIKTTRSSKDRFEAVCLSGKCEWYIRATLVKGTDIFQVRKLEDRHTCSKTQIHPNNHQVNKTCREILKETMILE